MTDVKERYIKSKTEAREWSHGSKHGEERQPCSPAVANQNHEHLDGWIV